MYTGTFLSAETLQRVGPAVPKEFWVRGAQLLMEEIFRGGCADSLSQSLAVVLMGLGPPDVSQYMGGPLSPYTVQCLRHVMDFMDLTFKLETLVREDEEDRTLRMGADKVVLTCLCGL